MTSTKTLVVRHYDSGCESPGLSRSWPPPTHQSTVARRGKRADHGAIAPCLDRVAGIRYAIWNPACTTQTDKVRDVHTLVWVVAPTTAALGFLSLHVKPPRACLSSDDARNLAALSERHTHSPCYPRRFSLSKAGHGWHDASLRHHTWGAA